MLPVGFEPAIPATELPQATLQSAETLELPLFLTFELPFMPSQLLYRGQTNTTSQTVSVQLHSGGPRQGTPPNYAYMHLMYYTR